MSCVVRIRSAADAPLGVGGRMVRSLVREKACSPRIPCTRVSLPSSPRPPTPPPNGPKRPVLEGGEAAPRTAVGGSSSINASRSCASSRLLSSPPASSLAMRGTLR
eukprot:2973410-Rhodomonas_salina.1